MKKDKNAIRNERQERRQNRQMDRALRKEHRGENNVDGLDQQIMQAVIEGAGVITFYAHYAPQMARTPTMFTPQHFAEWYSNELKRFSNV